MVMLDILKNEDTVVAHFDHGTRESAKDDAEFVQRKAQGYQKLFASGCGRLGENASEETARVARYRFLRKASTENDGAAIFTAHHLDDLVESVAINLLRGTGWRGLAVLDTPDICRPFLEPEIMPDNLQNLVPFDKKAIREYAAQHRITYRQDPTNQEDHYLRNRVRERSRDLPQKVELYQLWQRQKKLKREIDRIVAEILPAEYEPWQRGWFRELNEKVALELLRAGTLRAGIRATRPQLENFRQAILNYPSGRYFNLPGDHLIKLSKTEFYLEGD